MENVTVVKPSNLLKPEGIGFLMRWLMMEQPPMALLCGCRIVPQSNALRVDYCRKHGNAESLLEAVKLAERCIDLKARPPASKKARAQWRKDRGFLKTELRRVMANAGYLIPNEDTKAKTADSGDDDWQDE